jgi:hypothetical protein
VNLIFYDAGGLECVVPGLETLPVRNREHVGVRDRAEPAHLIGLGIAQGFFLDREREHRSGPAPRRLGQARARDQDLRCGKHQLHALCTLRQLR